MTCKHNWKLYTGLEEQFNYCEHCGIKQKEASDEFLEIKDVYDNLEDVEYEFLLKEQQEILDREIREIIEEDPDLEFRDIVMVTFAEVMIEEVNSGNVGVAAKDVVNEVKYRLGIRVENN